jgi:hypothetical protein
VFAALGRCRVHDGHSPTHGSSQQGQTTPRTCGPCSAHSPREPWPGTCSTNTRAAGNHCRTEQSRIQSPCRWHLCEYIVLTTGTEMQTDTGCVHQFLPLPTWKPGSRATSTGTRSRFLTPYPLRADRPQWGEA